MTLREQATSILRVAKLSFLTAPGAVLFKLFGAFVSALMPLVTAYYAAITTTALVAAYSGDTVAAHNAVVYVIVTALLGLVLLTWRSVDQYIQASMRYKIEAKVSDQMYEHFLGLEFWRYDDKETADLYDKSQRFAQFFAWVFDRFAMIISELIGLVSGVIALLLVNGWLALAILVATIPGVYIQFKLSRSQIAHWNSNVDVRRTRNMIEWDMLQPNRITELRLYGIVRHLLNLRKKLRDQDEKARIDFERQYIGQRIAADVLQTAAEVGALVWIALEIVARHQPVGQFVYVQQVVSRALGGATGFIRELSTVDEDVSNLFEYEQFMQLAKQSKRDSHLQAPPQKIEFENVSFHYHQAKDEVLRNISLQINRNEHIAIVGENGAGKSTLIKLLSGLYAPTDGHVRIDGVELSDIDISSWHKQLGVLAQNFSQYQFATARDNVLFGNIEHHDEAMLEQALSMAEAKHFTEKLPKGLDTYLSNWMEDDSGEKGVDLSGGQWQRIALARNFYRNAPIIILDEPTSAIDALAEARIFERLFKEKNKTIITISHRLTTIKKAGTVYMMKDGQIVEEGTCEDLLAQKGEFYTMFRSQL